jgi:GTPase SAR1 family protein
MTHETQLPTYPLYTFRTCMHRLTFPISSYQDKLLKPTAESTSSIASLLNSQIDNSSGELLLCLSAHNLHERSIGALLEQPDHTTSNSPSLPLVSQSDIDTALHTLQEAASEVSLHASLLWNPLDQAYAAEQVAIANYSPQFTVNDEDTAKRWNADKSVYIMIRSKPHTAEELTELRVAVVGNVDAGKSTLLGVITKGRLDDGRGKARVSLFRHKHEIESGRTSSVGMEILGFGPNGTEIMGDTASREKDLSWDEICKEASKIIGFIDLAGHEKYFKTTIGALASCSPDFVLLIVGANAGIVGMSKEHLSVALALNAPVVCVVTKVDSTPANVLDATCKQLSKILRSPGCRKSPVYVKNRGMACSLAADFVQQKAAPIFLVSNVNGDVSFFICAVL